jgi:hypothetical protein
MKISFIDNHPSRPTAKHKVHEDHKDHEEDDNKKLFMIFVAFVIFVVKPWAVSLYRSRYVVAGFASSKFAPDIRGHLVFRDGFQDRRIDRRGFFL